MVILNHPCMVYKAAPLSKLFAEVMQTLLLTLLLLLQVLLSSSPRVGFVKLNSDVALDSSCSLVGIGLVLRNGVGLVFGSSWQWFGSNLSSQAAEGEDVLRCLQFALDVGVSSVIVESDASSLVDLINGKVVVFSEISLVVAEIQTLCLNFHSCLVVFGSKKVN
ncbi:hypothetical protein ACOSQ3_023568 [Xanthoceras sorbifolium]